MAILQVRNIDDRLYASLKALAERERRSVSQEVIHILEDRLKGRSTQGAAQEEALEKLGETLSDEDAGRMIRDIRRSRKNSARFSPHRALFD